MLSHTLIFWVWLFCAKLWQSWAQLVSLGAMLGPIASFGGYLLSKYL